jgi:phospholipid/cholesterol/gamma-HCH transport system substrate-binding protein
MTSTRPKRATDFRVGLFVMTALAIGGTVVFAIGTKRNMFESKLVYHVAFRDVGGLAPGSPVRIAGVTVGEVKQVDMRTQQGDVHVTLRVVRSATRLLRDGSTATLGNKGLLGDRLVDITPGRGGPLREHSWIPATDAVDLTNTMQKAGVLLTEMQATAKNLRAATDPLGDPAFGNDIKSATHDLSVLLRSMAEGKGFLPKLFSDEELSDRLTRAIANAEGASAELHASLKNVHSITDTVRTGPGTAHELVYGTTGSKLIDELTVTTREIGTMLQRIRSGKGTLHDLVYENKADALIANLEATTANLKAITDDVRAGRGTMGALLMDPSVYEDVKRLVGDLQRNEVLRALVRYSIRNDESRVDPAQGKGRSRP